MPNFVDSGYRIIRNFLGTSEELLFSGVIEPNPGQLYGGTTGNFGNTDYGSIFSCNTNGSGYQVLHNFGSVPDGACFRSNFLKGSDGLLYGVTSFGGLNYTVSGGTYNGGTIFTYNTTTDALNILHRFSGITGNDGAEPYSSLIEISGTGIFYGTTRAGGLSSGTVTPQGCGVIYTCNTAGNYGVIHNMLGNGSEGMEPSELLDGGDGFLYGTAFIGGSYGYGTLFRTDLFGNLTVLRNFSGVTYSDGENPVGPLIRASDGLLYGATYLGGLYGYGTIYTYDTTTNVYDIIHNFQYANGGRPLVGLTEYPGSNQIFGVANSGGSNRTGVVFFIEIGTPNSYTIVHQFYGAPNDGRQPRGKILVGSNGSLFGTTNSSNVFNIDDDDDSYEGVEAGGVIYTWDTAYCQVTASTTFNCLQLLGVQYPPCPGVCTGSLTAFTDTGVDPHTYYLTNIDTSQVFSGNSFPNDVAIFTGLCVGNYSLQAVDSIGFIENYPTTIVLNGTFDVQLVNYIGQSCISIDGGTPPYTILVNGNPITYTLPVSCFPTSCNVVYNVLVTDTNGCQFTGQTTGSCNTNFGVTSTTVTDFTCNNEGTIGINLSGDCTSYEFNLYDYNTSALISGPTIGGSNFIFTGLNPGTYYATVSGCSNPPLLILNNPPFVVNDNDTLFTEVTQLGNNALCVTITGGTQPYQILIDGSLETWSYSQNTNCYNALSCTIDHTVVVIDASGCTATTVTDFTCSTPSISVVSIVQPTCTNDGEITVSISGGTPNYTITATNVTTNQQIIATNVTNTYTFSNLLEGIWTFVASDSDGFIGTIINVNLTNEFFIDLSFNGITPSGLAQFCFIVTGTTNDLLTTVTTPLSTNIFIATGNTINCFTVPISCGFEYSIKIEENIVSSETCLQVSANDCLPSVQYVRTGTTINGLPSYSFIINNIPYQISWDPTNTYLSAGAWILTNTITNTICAYRAQTLIPSFFSIYPIGQTGQWVFIGSNSPDCICISLSSQFSTAINNCAGCSDYLEFTVPCGPLGVIVSSFNNPFCGCNGQIIYTATGGTSPYTYVISEINSTYQVTNTTGIFNGLCEGTYSVEVTDYTGGTATSSSLFLNDTFDVIPTISSTISSAGTSTYCISISGGSGGYDLSIDSYTTGVTNGTYCFQLNAGQCYDVVVQDNINANCFYSALTCIPNQIFGCQGISVVEPKCGQSNGSITVTITGGSPNYEYAIYSATTLLPPIHTTTLTSYTFTGLTQGEYSIIVTDFFNTEVYCYSGVTLQIDFFVDINISGTCESIFNYCLIVSGGTPPYTHTTGLNTYSMSVAGTYCYTATCGTYQFIVTDSGLGNNQCSYDEIFTINCGLTLSSTTELNACGTGGAGAITIYTILGGVSPYSYSFDYGQTYYTIPFLNGLTFSSNIFGPLFPAEYPIIIRDLSGCTASTSVTIIDQPIVNVSAVTTPENCSYSGNGTITITASGGASPYQYSIDDGVTYSPNNYFTGLTIGTYLISVLDSDNCEGTTTAIVYPPIVLSGVSTPESCKYNSGGTISVSVIQSTYGTSPYQFSINGVNFQTSTLFTGLTFGTYTITVKDLSGCTATTTTIIDPPIIITTTTTPDNCFSGGVGTILVNASSGIPPYQYSFSGGSFTNLNYFTGLTVGNYTISAIDSTGCSATTIVNIEVASPITITASTTDESCYVSSGGTIFVLTEGGIPPYQYSVDYGNTYTTSPYFVGFTIGSYDVYVKDFYGCSASTVATISSASAVSLFQTTALTPTCVGLNILEATLSATGGTVPYTFVWTIPLTPPAYVSSQIITVTDYVFDPGIYSFTGTVYDRFGCSATSVFNYSVTSADTPTLQIFSAGTLFCDASQGVILTSSATTSSGFYDEIYWYNLLSGTTPSLITTGATQITAFTPGIYYYVIDYDICLYSSSTITVDYPQTEPPVIGTSVILCPCSSTQLEVIPNGITYTDFVWSDGQSGSTITISSCTEGEYVYYLTAKDQFNCTVTSNTVTVIYSPLEINVFKVDATCCNCADGFVELQVVNAVGPLTFNWVGTVNSTNTANNLLPGTYTVTVTDTVTNCVSVLTFEIFCEEVVECIYEPIRDANGDIILNPDGTISFYDVTVLPTTRIVDVIPEECCLEYSTTDLLLEHCNGRCYWRQRGCANTSAQKILLGADQTNGVEISDNIDENCQNQITFKYLFNFDCESLFNCVDLSYSGNVLSFLTGLTAYATVEVLTGNTYVTKQTVPIWKFDINKTPTGVYFGGQDNFCDIINELIINQLGSSCTGLTSNTFSPAWQQASFKVYDSLKGKTIKIGLLLEGFNCDYNILVDDIKIEEVCLISNEQLLTDDCIGFDLEKIPDNKKSWIYNEDKYDRDWNHLKYRNTSYDDFHERLDINTKEIDLNVDVARAIEYDTYCYSLEVPCYLDDNCTSPERISSTATAQTLSLSTTLTAIFNTDPIRIQTGKIYKLKFRVQTTGPGIPTNLVIGFGNGGALPLYNDPTIILVGGSVGTLDYEYIIDLTSLPTTTYTHTYFRIAPWTPSTVRTYTIFGRPTLSMTEICPITKQTLIDNYVNVNSETTFEEFKSQIQQNLIDPKTRQGISDYPLLRYLYERYLNFCGLNPCTDKSNQYNYNTLTDFVKLIGNYWIDLVEQFVPATAIWKGGSMVYRNTMFDQPKFQYKNFNIGYCDDEYCFEGDLDEPTYSAACYVAQYGATELTPIGFSSITNNITSFLKPNQIGGLIIGCSDASGITCCNTNPMGCFVSATVGFKFIEGTKNFTHTIVNTNPNKQTMATQSEILNIFYSGLSSLGYNNQYPNNNLVWSIPTTNGCSDQIEVTPIINLVYSCVTASTITITGVTGNEISFESIFGDYLTGDQYSNVFPTGKMALSGGTVLYGIATDVNTSQNGYIYSCRISGSSFNLVKSFNISVDGVRSPASGLVLASDGYLYGTTLLNNIVGSQNFGALYRVNPLNPNATFTVLRKFSPIDRGTCWLGQEILYHSNNRLYIPLLGSSIYEWNIATQTGTLLFVFPTNNKEFFLSENTITGEIIGVSSAGGTKGDGTIFKLLPSNPLGTYTVLYNFDSSLLAPNNIKNPSGPLLQSGTNFYGLTNGNNTGAGFMSIYRYDSTTNTVTPLHRFFNTIPPEGRNPKGNLLLIANRIYGICTTGGGTAGSSTTNLGTIFRYDLVNNTLNTVKQFPTNLTDGRFVSTVYGNLLYNSTDGYVYGTTPLGGSDLKGNLYRFIFTGGTFTSTTQVTGVAYYSCDLEGDETGIDTMLWDKQLVTYTSSTYVNGTSLQGISCLTYCSTYVENPNVEVIIEDYTDLITDPCKKPTLINQCNIIYATHIDNDIWYDGSVSVVLPTTDNNNTELGDFDIISTE